MSLPETYKVIKANHGGEPSIAQKQLSKPLENQVLVKIEFATINPTDLLRLGGTYGKLEGEQALLNGVEGSGIVAAVGTNLKYPFKVGDRVHVKGPGAFGQYFTATTDNVYPIQQADLSLEDASSNWANPVTVLVMGILAEKGNHKAVIHSAGSSALGRMLIRHLKQKGIKSINIVRRDDYTEELKKEGADYVLNSKSPDFEAQLKEIAEKEKATLAFDAIGGDFTNKILSAQPPSSTCLVYGLLSGVTTLKEVSIFELFKGKTLSAFGLYVYLAKLSEQEVRDLLTKAHSLLPTVLKTKVEKVFKLEELKEALAYYHENSSKGKVLLKLH